MSEVNVVTIGYYNYTVDDEFLSELLTAVAKGQIRSVEKKYNNGVYKVILGKALDLSVERLEVITSKEAELNELRERLKKLEQSDG